MPIRIVPTEQSSGQGDGMLEDVEDAGPEPTGYRSALIFAIILVLAVLGYSLYAHSHGSRPASAPLEERVAPQ